ncbi:MAG: restriction endonuclease subunit S [Thiolinea sp.]
MTNQLPNGWLRQQTETVFEQVSTNTKKINTKNCLATGKFPVIDQGQDFIAGFVNDESKVIRSEKPLIIFGDHTRVVKWIDKAFVPGADGTKILITKSFIESRFFYYQLKSINITDKGYARHFKELKESIFLIPPLAEQKEISTLLDNLLAQVDTLKTRLDAIPNILKRFRQSVLAAAVSGKLTEEWRVNKIHKTIEVRKISDELFEIGLTHGNFGKKLDRAPTIESDELKSVVKHINNWSLVRIGEICKCIVPNRDKPQTFSGGYHWLLTHHFHEDSININYKNIEKGLSNEEIIKYKAKVIEEKSIIMTCIGRVGLSAVLKEKAVINQQSHAFIPNDYVIPEYIAYCIRANKTYFEEKATSTTVSYLNKTACNSLPIPLASIEEQKEIVRRVEELFAFADQIEQRVKSAQQRVNHLTQAILAKAFRGELTAEWREQNPDLISGENSAAALLARIQAERKK